MTYDMAKMVIWSPDAYDRKCVWEAALVIGSSLSTSQEDFDQVCSVEDWLQTSRASYEAYLMSDE